VLLLVAVVFLICCLTRLTKRFVLEFEDHVVSTNKHFSPESTDNEIDLNILWHDTEWEFHGQSKLHMLEAMVQWKVSTVQRTRLTSNSVKTNKRKEKLAKLLAGAGAEDTVMKS
jgi:hypothetical protein